MTEPLLVVRTRLIPPRLKPHLLRRPRLTSQLARLVDHRVTILKAEAGYGKTTALASLAADMPGRVVWYSLSEADADPLVYLLHLVEAFGCTYPGTGVRSRALLAQEGGAAKYWAPAIDALANDLIDALRDEVVLVLDDYQLVDRPEIDAITERLVAHMPACLHLAIATRRSPRLAGLARWRALGDVLDLSKKDLELTAAEVEELFAGRSGPGLSDGEADALVAETEGWVIALHMIRQHLWDGQPLDHVLRHAPDTLASLFEYLAQEVLARQPPAAQQFLLRSAVLRRLDAELCDALLGRHDSATLLHELDDRSLFLTPLEGGAYRYHHLFQEFLATRARARSPGRWQRLHRRAAVLLQARGTAEEAIFHAVEAGDVSQAADLLESVATTMVQAGRYDTLAAWLDRLPTPLLAERPALCLARGDAARLTSRFELALQAYEQARRHFTLVGDREGESRALEGEALIYLDTVQPARADPLLRQALRLVDRRARRRRADLLLLLAENSTNHGDLARAERVQRAVRRAMDDRTAADDPRTAVRQGRFAEARAVAERTLGRDAEGALHRPPRSHRESAAVLSWICAFTGEGSAARTYAEQALQVGRQLRSPIVEVVALSRLGHGWLTGADADPNRALEIYRQSLELADAIGVTRFRVESLLGQVVAGGLLEHHADAERSAREGLAILDEAGDRYLASVVWLALGAARVRCGRADSLEAIERGAEMAVWCGDSYGPCLADLWRAHLALRQADEARFADAASRLLRTAHAFAHPYLLLAHPFLGLERRADLDALLRTAVARRVEPDLAASFLARLAASPPGAGVRTADAPRVYVQALGPLRIWRDDTEVGVAGWKREKALQLFQYLLCQRGRPVQREEALEALWPEVRLEPATSGLRVALTALEQALDPYRPPGMAPRCVRRAGPTLQLDPALVRVDADDFLAAVHEARRADAAGDLANALPAYGRALALYRGAFLADCLYEDWTTEPREDLQDVYLATASRAVDLLAARGDHEQTVELCQQVLARDRCWERGYACLMRAHAALGHRSQALRAYERCRRNLREDLDAAPSPELQRLYHELSDAGARAAGV